MELSRQVFDKPVMAVTRETSRIKDRRSAIDKVSIPVVKAENQTMWSRVVKLYKALLWHDRKMPAEERLQRMAEDGLQRHWAQT